MRLELQQRSLDELVTQISAVTNDELKSHLSKYFCVLVSGYVENYIKDLVAQFHEKSCKKETARFVTAKMRNLTNLDDGKITAFLELFNAEWSEAYLDHRTDEMEAAFNTIYAQRNKIAHGSANNSNITYNSILTHYKAVKDAMVILSMVIVK